MIVVHLQLFNKPQVTLKGNPHMLELQVQFCLIDFKLVTQTILLLELFSSVHSTVQSQFLHKCHNASLEPPHIFSQFIDLFFISDLGIV